MRKLSVCLSSISFLVGLDVKQFYFQSNTTTPSSVLFLLYHSELPKLIPKTLVLIQEQHVRLFIHLDLHCGMSTKQVITERYRFTSDCCNGLTPEAPSINWNKCFLTLNVMFLENNQLQVGLPDFILTHQETCRFVPKYFIVRFYVHAVESNRCWPPSRSWEETNDWLMHFPERDRQILPQKISSWKHQCHNLHTASANNWSASMCSLKESCQGKYLVTTE